MDESRSQPRAGMLLIVDHLDERVFSGLDQTTAVTVLPLGVMPALYQSRLSESIRRLAVTIFPVAEVADKAMARVRYFYPDFLRDRISQPVGNGPSLLELLSFDEGSQWWFTESAEKSPLRTPFINQLYNLAVIDEALSHGAWDKIRISLSDRVLGECIESGIRRRGVQFEVCLLAHNSLSNRVKSSFWFRFFALRMVMGAQAFGNRLVLSMMRARKLLMNNSPDVVVYSRYPVLYAEPFSNPRERNLGELIESLGCFDQVWQVVLLNLWPWEILQHYFEVRRAFSEAQIVPLLLLSTISDLLMAFSGVSLLGPCWKYRRLRPEVHARFGDWDVGPAWRSELDRSLTGVELLTNLILFRAMRRLAITYHPRVVIHPCEFQPMERAIWSGLQPTETRSVAVQHTTVSSNTLMYFFAKNEIRDALSGENKLATPLPDYYLTTGDRPLEIMRDAGYPESRSAVVGAVRYNELRVEAWSSEEKASLRRKLGLPTTGNIVLVATSSDLSDSMALLESLKEAISHLPAATTFLFKSHYHCRVEIDVARLFVTLAPENRRIIDVDADLHSYLRASNALVVTNSTTGLEAIALGCPPVVFDNCAILNIGPLGDLRDAALFAESPKELAEAIKAALDSGTLDRLRRVWPSALRRTFHALDGKALTRFMNFLKEKHLLLTVEDAYGSAKSPNHSSAANESVRVIRDERDATLVGRPD